MRTMRAPFVSLLLFCGSVAGCGRAVEAGGAPPPIVDGPPSLGRVGVASIAPTPEPLPRDAGTVQAVQPAKLVPDEEVGPLLAKLSETPGDFPSENYVSNELSLLDIASTLRDPKLRGRAYVGVGPDQNLTYLALLEPAVAYVVDIRRGNFLEHMFFRGCFEAGETRAGFLRALVSRKIDALPVDAPFSAIADAFRAAPADPALRDEGVVRTKAVLDRLHVVRARGDDAAIARIQGAFAKHGLSIAYTMSGSPRTYPTLGEILSIRDPATDTASFLFSEERYRAVRRLVMENRVLPIVGDFGGAHALKAVGEDMRARKLSLGVFYTSNVEQYLFDGRKHGAFVDSVGAMPHDDASRIVRVWFDQGRPHPAQGRHRTTQLSIPVDVFLERAAQKPFRSYWEVATQSP